MTGTKSQKPENFTEYLVWHSGEDGLETFYVYGLTILENKIVAFAEGRIGRRDKDPHHIVGKISTDGGVRWSENIYIAGSEMGETFNNPAPVVDRKSGRICLFYARNYGNEATDLFLTTSFNAQKWSRPEKLTELLAGNSNGWTLHLPGPGHGLQTRAGRLIVPIWHRRSLKLPPQERNYGVSIIYSDNGGTSWQNGGIVPLGDYQLNESRIIELKNGELLLNARSGAFVSASRFQSRSADGGLTWSEPRKLGNLPASYSTAASFLQAGKKLLLIKPDKSDAREDLAVYYSDDEGETWQFGKFLYRGVAGYSDAVLLNENTIGVIYGRNLLEKTIDVEGNVREAIFARFDFESLLTGETKND